MYILFYFCIFSSLFLRLNSCILGLWNIGSTYSTQRMEEQSVVSLHTEYFIYPEPGHVI